MNNEELIKEIKEEVKEAVKEVVKETVKETKHNKHSKHTNHEDNHHKEDAINTKDNDQTLQTHQTKQFEFEMNKPKQIEIDLVKHHSNTVDSDRKIREITIEILNDNVHTYQQIVEKINARFFIFGDITNTEFSKSEVRPLYYKYII